MRLEKLMLPLRALVAKGTSHMDLVGGRLLAGSSYSIIGFSIALCTIQDLPGKAYHQSGAFY